MVFPHEFQSAVKSEVEEALTGVHFYNYDGLSPSETVPDAKRAEFKINRGISFYPEEIRGIDCIAVMDLHPHELEEKIAEQQEVVDLSFKKLMEMADTLQKETLILMIWRHALKRKIIKPVESTHNKWAPNSPMSPNEGMTCSNATYVMRYHLMTQTRWDTQQQENVPYAWYVTWWISMQNPVHCSNRSGQIAGQDRKRFSSEKAAINYIQGRVRAYEHLFREEFPPVPKEWASNFRYLGMLLPGYRMEEKA